ncbi:class C beta-lactamase [Pseudomonas alcaligenes]|uniref:Beta-lactamase n=1 Tax=Aquipseudomonas alcaligenes TaxID=43263 RepID=A0ABR7RYU4_AQUAC|nr:class C beta-lactamase [Pseudomonas alcaligenes]MBC9249922.1 class C beta-lactamase [Pseudomonas alcaligenes]
MYPSAKLCAALLLLAGSRLALADNAAAAIDALVQSAAAETMQQHQIPGLAIALSVNGQSHYYNYGVASRQTGQAVSSDTLFEIGSVSKTFTVTLAAYAQAKGQLSLSDQVGKHLPELQGSPFAEVTLVNLATHTAGGFPLQVPEAVHDNAQLLDYLKAWQPQYSAGSQRTYANPSIGMLGVIAAKSLHLPYAEALERQLFPALGMPNSYLRVPANRQALYAQGYSKDDAPARLNPGVLADEAYGVKTSARDLLHFVEAQLGHTELQPQLAQALRATRTGYFTLGAMTQDLIWEQYRYPVALEALLQGNSSQVAYQSHAVNPLQPPLPAQDAVWVNKTGSTNGFGAYVAFVPARQIGIVLLANRNYPNEARVRLAYRILSALE